MSTGNQGYGRSVKTADERTEGCEDQRQFTIAARAGETWRQRHFRETVQAIVRECGWEWIRKMSDGTAEIMDCEDARDEDDHETV